ncbi:hypothetical protein DM02DRAFT_187880 [Periconia macrospinosa]|uniref:Uncharacterized protein n=1 Tax=Periconia macrospinosa TaxID=97972 RepID=A0A2V1E1T5_9PLEO|nr:hypothetical protein DM02DRAFT_187880 [Periconia macrospinosa]
MAFAIAGRLSLVYPSSLRPGRLHNGSLSPTVTSVLCILCGGWDISLVLYLVSRPAYNAAFSFFFPLTRPILPCILHIPIYLPTTTTSAPPSPLDKKPTRAPLSLCISCIDIIFVFVWPNQSRSASVRRGKHRAATPRKAKNPGKSKVLRRRVS